MSGNTTGRREQGNIGHTIERLNVKVDIGCWTFIALQQENLSLYLDFVSYQILFHYNRLFPLIFLLSEKILNWLRARTADRIIRVCDDGKIAVRSRCLG